MRTITLEEHFAPPGFLDGPGRELKERFLQSGERGRLILEQVVDVGGKRIAEMDAAGIDMQVLSLNAPGNEQLDAAESAKVALASNDFLAAAVSKHPARFAALAALPTATKSFSGSYGRSLRSHGLIATAPTVE